MTAIDDLRHHAARRHAARGHLARVRRTSCASPRSSTSSASPSSRAAGRARTRRTPSSSRARATSTLDARRRSPRSARPAAPASRPRTTRACARCSTPGTPVVHDLRQELDRCTCSEVLRITPDENLRDDRGERRASCARTAGASSTTPSTSSTAARADADVRARDAARGRARRRRDASSCATPTAARCRGRSRTRVARVVARARGRRSASTPTTTAAARVANSLGGGARRRAPRAGHDQRLRRALRQRQPVRGHPRPRAQARPALPAGRRARRRSRERRALRRRGRQPRARRALPYVGRSAFAHKGGVHVAAMRRDAARRTSTSTRRSSATRTRVVVSELVGPRQRARQGRGATASASTTAPRRSARATSRQREARGFAFEAAEASVALMLRRASAAATRPPFELVDYKVMVGQREGGDRRRGDDQGRASAASVVHTAAEGNGPVSALDAALRKALAPAYPEVAGDPARRLQGAHPRRRARAPSAITRVLIDSGDGARPLDAPSARRRTSSRPRGTRSPTASSTACAARGVTAQPKRRSSDESRRSSCCPVTASAPRSSARPARVLEAVAARFGHELRVRRAPHRRRRHRRARRPAARRDARGLPSAPTPCCSAPSAGRSGTIRARKVRPEQGLLGLRKRARPLRQPAPGARASRARRASRRSRPSASTASTSCSCAS